MFSASALGTQRLLHRMRDEGHLPNISPRLGHLSRTNSESIGGVIAPDASVDYSQGIAITSSFHPDANTHIEPVRYGPGSNLMSLLQSVLTDGDGDEPRWRTWLREMWRQRRDALQPLRHEALVRAHRDRPGDAEPGQLDHDVHQRIPGTRKRYLTSRQGHGLPNPTWIPAGNEAIRSMARIMNGFPGSAVGDAFNKPLTAHFIGGCAIGDAPATGVIDPYQRVYGHPGLHVVDGSAVTANLGVNPSLTITAQAERALAFWPNRGEADPRPALGEPYRAHRRGAAGRSGGPGGRSGRAAAADRRGQLRQLVTRARVFSLSQRTRTPAPSHAGSRSRALSAVVVDDQGPATSSRPGPDPISAHALFGGGRAGR